MHKIGTKYALLLGYHFEKIIVIFDISTLIFVYFQILAEKQKCLKLRTKMPYLGIFGLEFENIVIFEINSFEFV